MIVVGWENGSVIARAEAVVRPNLRDPDSAQFQDIVVFRHGNKHTACGSVNSKNGSADMSAIDALSTENLHMGS